MFNHVMAISKCGQERDGGHEDYIWRLLGNYLYKTICSRSILFVFFHFLKRLNYPLPTSQARTFANSSRMVWLSASLRRFTRASAFARSSPLSESVVTQVLVNVAVPLTPVCPARSSGWGVCVSWGDSWGSTGRQARLTSTCTLYI